MDTYAFPTQSARTRRFTLGLPRDFTLSPDGERILFLRTRGPEDPVVCLWLLADNEEHLLATDVGTYTTDTAMSTVAYTTNGELWSLSLDPTPGATSPPAASPSSPPPAAAQPRRAAVPGPVSDPRLDPTGRRVAYVSGRSLRVVDVAGSNDQLVASDDDPEVSWGVAEYIAAEEMHRTRGHWWSPDGTRLMAARVDLTPVQRWWIADPANPAEPPRQVPYPAAGTPNALVSLHTFDLAGGSTQLRWDATAYEYLATADWDSHGPLLSVQSRDQRTLQILAADPDTGETHLLHEQRDAAWVQLIDGVPGRTTSGKLVHTEDAGETRYLTVDGARVTPDGLQLRVVLKVDGESVLFLASDEPTECHLWLYDETGLQQLSDAPGSHEGYRAGNTLLLSSNTEAGRTYVVRRNGQEHPITSHRATPAATPHITWLQAGDLQIRTALLLPSWHQPGTKLPVVMAPYAGPAMSLVMKVAAPWFYKAQWYADAGFAVVIADGRGTPGRGPAWEKTVHHDLLAAPIEDQITALHAAAEHCPDLDLTRVGITGWSFGGMLATAAVLRRPDVFHAGISGAGPAEQRLYDTHWRERFLGHPDEYPADYDRSSTVNEAAKLERPLLLVHGLADDNVFAAHTLRLSAALLKAGRPHQVLPLTGAAHSPTDEATVVGLLLHELNFLKTSLGADEPAAPGTPRER
ncbi:prolyl oligopeptidase family serine peptidase [Kribbella sp. NPDC051718]|uniref:S9 family peptidase n=1 Tax=Kribbella sp. NPDC051718 TaxID=3155168 RepID=UPI003435F37E